ncbi:MAG TPA: fibronectin type III domain-containing protein, partial [Pseudolysinimonas sp.]|nr:fibronectin type III domain-containing protein [Pseudolysinimonas sp.]
VQQGTQTITVTPGDRRTAIAYRVTNPDDGLTATAFIVVPPKQSGQNVPPPYLDPKLPPQVVDMNGQKEWKLSDILIVPSKKPVILIDTDEITAPNSDGTKLNVGNDTVRFAARQGFRGQTTLVFRVTDGTSKDDPNGRQSLISLPITVGDPNQLDEPPTFSALALQIEAGEPATVRDLRESTDHPSATIDKSQFTYSGLTGSTADISASLSGSQLSVSAPLGVQPGAHTTLHATIHYRSFSVPATITVTVVSSSRPRIQANEDDAKGQRGKTDTVNVLANDTNPFPDRPLTLTNAVIENAAESNASISYTASGDVTIRPGASFIGVVSVIYTVRDATKDPSRDVTGRLQYTVRDVPGQPNAPTFVEGDQQVTLQWEAPATNGEPITSYTITCSGTGCPASTTVPGTDATHVFTGLTNGDAYTFRISAHNALGDGAISATSGTAKPFGNPSPVTSATISGTNDGSGKLNLSWGAANGNGRSISGYHITLSDGTQKDTSGTGTTAVMAGHVGTQYSFTIVAKNDGGRSSTSVGSNATTPLPGQPSASASGSGQTVTYSWGPAASTEPVTYQISGAGISPHAVASSGSESFTGSYGSSYSFTITATSAGQTSSRTSNTVTLVNPYSIQLCYGSPGPNGWNYLGVAWSGNTGGHHVTFSSYSSSVDFSEPSGSRQSGAYNARDTSGDLNTVITWVDNGTSHQTRWGDAPPC